MHARTAHRLASLAAPGAFFLLLGLLFGLIRQYGSELPFHDQWDAEGLHLLRPWRGGADLVPFIFRFHNEHHPVLTKLIALGLAAVDGMWNALPQMLLNTVLQGGVLLLLVRLAHRHLPPRSAWLVAAAGAIALSLPLLWENLLWGFQSQFHLAVLLGLAHLDLVWSERRLGWRWAAGAIVGLLTLGTIAAGFLSVTAGGLVALTFLGRAGAERRHALATLGLAVGISLVGVAMIHPVPYPAVARNTFSALEAWLILAGWPVGRSAAAFWLLVPALGLLVAQSFGPDRRPTQPWLLALVVWLGLATAGFAYGRAELIGQATPRYCDFLTVNILVGLVCVLHFAWAQVRGRRVVRVGALVWAAVVVLGFFSQLQTLEATNDLAARSDLQTEQARLVRAFVLAGDTEVLNASVPARLIHESADQRLNLLRDQGIRGLLPPGVRTPLKIDPAPASHDFVRQPFDKNDPYSPAWILNPGSGGGRAYLLSDWIQPERFPLLRFRVRGGLDGLGHRLQLQTASGTAPLDALGATHGTAGQWINFPMPTVPFRIEAWAEPGTSPLEFSDPVALSRLSWLTGKILGAHAGFAWAGTLLLALAGAGAWTGPRASAPPPLETGTLRLPQRGAAALSAVVAMVALFGWPRPFVFSVSGREGRLLEPEAWSARAVPDFHVDPAESGAGFAPGNVNADVAAAGAYFGSYGPHGDADTADTVSAPFALDANWLCVPVAGYPDLAGNSLAMEVLDEHGAVTQTFRYAGPNPGERGGLWPVDLSGQRGKRARLHGTDAATGHLGWLAFAPPWLLDDPAVLKPWQSLADSNRLLWLRYFVLGIAAILGGLSGWAEFRRTRSQSVDS